MVVGSGYGGSIAASRCARAGQSVCVLERGKEWRPGDFTEDFNEAIAETQVTVGGLRQQIGRNGVFQMNHYVHYVKYPQYCHVAELNMHTSTRLRQRNYPPPLFS